MEKVESLVRTSLEEIEKALSSRTVVGEPTVVEGITFIPLLCVGFCFGAGGGEGKAERQKGEGMGGGTGGAAWIKPIAIIIVDKSGARVEPIRHGVTSAIEKFAEEAPVIVEKWRQGKKEA
ncbi:MAG: sporulation protein YtfJ [Chloroflexi bacterium]|nr:sporulation protein YtfJ [Chloroflexota bacterium]